MGRVWYIVSILGTWTNLQRNRYILLVVDPALRGLARLH
jgi:hypothetical protein